MRYCLGKMVECIRRSLFLGVVFGLRSSPFHGEMDNSFVVESKEIAWSMDIYHCPHLSSFQHSIDLIIYIYMEPFHITTYIMKCI